MLISTQGARKATAAVLAGTLAITGAPIQAFAAPPSMPNGSQGGSNTTPSNGGSGGANTTTYDYTGSYTAALTANGTTVSNSATSYEQTVSTANVALAQNKGTLNVTGATLTKSGDSTDGDTCNFYGVNSIVLAVNSGSLAKIVNSKLNASSEGSNGIFATDSATAWANGTTISTTAANSRGLDATYGGTIVANDMTISTKGDHSASFATDRGGGYISVTDSDVSTAGSGSPLVYSTGCIEVSDVEGTATGSQIAGMEGLNTILIDDSTLTSTVTGKTASDPVANAVIIYQSTSGDADTSTGSTALFQATDSTLKSAITSGSFFYCTNTSANIVLKGTTLSYDSSAADLVTAAGNNSNNWGSAGSNGATVSFTGIGETLAGDAVADTISSLTMYLLEGTTWTGATEISTNSAGSTSSAPLTVNVDGTSKWVVTGDCTVSALNVASGGKVVDASGKTVTIVAGGKTVVSGTSSITVTVTGSYSTTVSTTSAQAVTAASIDRTAFDAAMGTSTAIDVTDGSDGGTDTDTDTPFNDVSSTDWFYDAAVWAKEAGLFQGVGSTGNLEPNRELTRAEAAMVLWRYFEPEDAAAYVASTATNTTSVNGIADGAWYTGAAVWAVENGIITGREQADGSFEFDPNDGISREELCTIIARAAEKLGSQEVEGASTTAMNALANAASVSSWAKESMAWATANGIVSGVGGTDLDPQGTVTRAQMATIMMRSVKGGYLG